VLAAAMIAGEVQIGTVGASAPTEARLGGADLVMLADTTPVMVFWLISRPEVRAVAELRGKRIGVTRLGTALHFGGRLALRHHGLDPEREVTWMNMSTLNAIVAGLEANALDAGVVTPIEKYQAQALGMNALFDIGTISPPFSQAGVVASQQFTRERPDLILRYLRGHLDGLKRLRADPAWGKQVMARWLQLDDPVVIDDSYDTYVRRYLPEIPLPRPEAVAPIIELLALTDPRASQLRPEDVVEPRFIQQLEAEGFFQRPPGGS
jgi:ABC-type nitrate/sulfonate/bicarbonate transport system substrate-binding protein